MKVGFVAIVGRPNTGKSTLLNAILDYKLSITSPVPQTTRNQIRGIYNDDESQIVFIDTPGIHKPKKLLGETLNRSSIESLRGADFVLFLQPSDENIGPGDRFIIDLLTDIVHKAAVITKLDLVDPNQAKERADNLKKHGFDEVFGTSDKMPRSIESLINSIKFHLPDGVPHYDRDVITDLSMRFVAKEIIRESALGLLRDEIPHAIGVIVDEFIDAHDDVRHHKIVATIYVERESQKGIVIGALGRNVKAIGIASRQMMQQTFGNPVHLDLRVKVKKQWTENATDITKMGY